MRPALETPGLAIRDVIDFSVCGLYTGILVPMLLATVLEDGPQALIAPL